MLSIGGNNSAPFDLILSSASIPITNIACYGIQANYQAPTGIQDNIMLPPLNQTVSAPRASGANVTLSSEDACPQKPSSLNLPRDL